MIKRYILINPYGARSHKTFDSYHDALQAGKEAVREEPEKSPVEVCEIVSVARIQMRYDIEEY